jgi:hypothetical protein
MSEDVKLQPGWLGRDVSEARKTVERERLAEIDRQITECHQWGAKLTALSEERRAIRRNLNLES